MNDKDNLVKVNIGCGPRFKNDWVNIEYGALSLINKFKILKWLIKLFRIVNEDMLQQWPKNFVYHNVVKSLPFKDNSVSYIYSSHVFEHFKRYELRKVLLHARRALIKGGVMRVVIPDIDNIILSYQNLKDSDNTSAMENLNKVFFVDLIDISVTKPTLMQRLMNIVSRPHRWMYNQGSFIEELEIAGFERENIFIRKFKEGLTPDIDFLDKLPDQSMYIEVIK